MRHDVIPNWTLSKGEVRFYKDEGYLLLPGLLQSTAIDAVREEIFAVMEAGGLSRERLQQAQSSREKLIQSGQYLADSTLDALINSAHLRALATQLMGGPSTLYMPFTAVKSGGGGGTFHFHQDNQYTRFDGPGINLWFALSDMSPENGCLQVVPRSHLGGTLTAVDNPDGDGHRTVAQEPARFLPVRMRAGDCIAFSRLTLHGSGPNTRQEPRLAYVVQFHRNDVNATRAGQMFSLLAHPPHHTAPVPELSRPNARSQDGH